MHFFHFPLQNRNQQGLLFPVFARSTKCTGSFPKQKNNGNTGGLIKSQNRRRFRPQVVLGFPEEILNFPGGLGKPSESERERSFMEFLRCVMAPCYILFVYDLYFFMRCFFLV